ncbi:MAG: DUF3489 domain-containing protein [Tabrizicola sp.]|nr:DUF3489 domain-containing protein [Tabrizicola sp.]
MARSPNTQTTDDTTNAVTGREETVPAVAPVKCAPRPGSKLAQVITMLEAPEGATIGEMMAATGWQQHTVRGALAGSIAKRLDRPISSEKIKGRGRVYRIRS